MYRKVFNQYIIEYLKSNEIDISDINYKESTNYKQVKNDRIFGINNNSMTIDEYIEHYLAKSYKVPHTYESIYCMGNTVELSPDECLYSALAEEIIDIMNLASEKDGIRDDSLVELKKDELVKNLTAQGGLQERLYRYLDFDLELFNETNHAHQCEKFKILYYFYILEKRGFPETQVLQIFSKPSMENIDNYSVGLTTSNGDIIREIKNSLEKELSLSAKRMIKGAIYEITSEWEGYLSSVMLQMCMPEYGYINYFEKIIEMLLSKYVPDKLSVADKVKEYKHSPIETLYIKVLQHECRSQIEDLIRINSIQTDIDNPVPPEFVEEMKVFMTKRININSVTEYIEANAFKIAKYVYLRLKIGKEDVRKIRNSKDKVSKLLDFCFCARPLFNITNEVPELFIISCLQAIILSKSNERFDYRFHAYEKQLTKKSFLHVHGALKNDKRKRKENMRVYDVLKIYWVRKVMDRWYANIGKHEERVKFRELESLCDGILIKILQNPNIDDILELHRYYITKFDEELIIREEEIIEIQKFKHYIGAKGFKYIDETYRIRYIFSRSVDAPQIYNSLISYINNMLKDGEAIIPCTFETRTKNGELRREIDFKLNFDYVNSVCTLVDFDITYSPQYIKRLESLGAVLVDF